MTAAMAAALATLLAGAPAPSPSTTFLKGQLHLHSNRSGDSQTPPADVVRWYAEHGFDFIVFTDHNRVTVEPGRPGMLVIPGVELTQNVRDCRRRPRRVSPACCTSTRCSSRPRRQESRSIRRIRAGAQPAATGASRSIAAPSSRPSGWEGSRS